jgi:hypothetical protein
MRNDTTEPMIIPGDPDPLQPGFVRIYEMFNWYKDVPIKEFEDGLNDPAYKILVEEIQKEIDKEIIETIRQNRKF